MTVSGLALRRRAAVARWLARCAGTVLLVLHIRQGAYELSHLTMVTSAYGGRIFSVGFLAMLLGVVVGWLSDRAAAVLLVGGFALAAAAPLLGECTRPMLAPDAVGVMLVLLPFLAVGLAYSYAGRTREPSA